MDKKILREFGVEIDSFPTEQCGSQTAADKLIQENPHTQLIHGDGYGERLKKCPDCGGNVSTSADKCPHCGKQMRMPNGCLWVITIICLLIAFALLFGDSLEEIFIPIFRWEWRVELQ